LELVILLVVLLLGLAILLLVAWRLRPEGARPTEVQDALSAGLDPLRQRIEGLETRVTGRLDSVQQTLVTSLGPSMRSIGEELVKLGAATQRMVEIGKDISQLQDLLRPPALRGAIGEILLERLLAACLPPSSYRAQHRFEDGLVVDYVIDLGEVLVPVDAKFPLDAFQRLQESPEDQRERLRRELLRQVRSHIDDVARYVRPDEGTLDFALMYVPAENVYYELVAYGSGEPGLFSYIQERRVFPVSPILFHAYLQTIALGLRGMQVERQARKILDLLSRLSIDFQGLRDAFRTLGTHLGHARDRYEELDRRMERFGFRLAQPPVEGEGVPGLSEEALPVEEGPESSE
jgi:DNA recombination protein RmuC